MGKKVYWKGIEQLTNDADFVKYADKEFAQELPIRDTFGDNTAGVKSNRRDFLKLMGFSVAAASLAACDAPVRKAIPYLNKPEEIDPGIANYYASTFFQGSDAWPVVVKTREGRPIFIQGNKFSALTKGGINSAVSASILELYDIEKQKNPTKAGEKISWADADKEIIAALGNARNIRIVTHSLMSPSLRRTLAMFAKKYNSTKLVTYDQCSASGILEANKTMFGKQVIPSYDFSKAKVIVSFDADFLGTWISEVQYVADYALTRQVGKHKKEMSKHFHFEPMMSITGANADYRVPIKPSQEGLVVAKLHNLVAQKMGAPQVSVPDIQVSHLEKAAKALSENIGHALVVSGSNDPAVQMLVNSLNNMLNSYGKTIDLHRPSFQRQGIDRQMNDFVDELKAGKVDAVVFYNCNPVYDHARGKEIAEAIGKLPLSIGTASRLDETTSHCRYNLPDSHFLESWHDCEQVKGVFSLGQPTIGTIFDTRQFPDSLLKWAGVDKAYPEVIKAYWKQALYPLQSKETSFESFWHRCLHDGVFSPKISADYRSQHEKSLSAIALTLPATFASLSNGTDFSVSDSVSLTPDSLAAAPIVSDLPPNNNGVNNNGVAPSSADDISPSRFSVGDLAAQINARYKPDNTAMEFVAYYNSVIGAGAQANNPLLQEAPDPITKVCWGNFIAVSQRKAQALGFKRIENKVSVAKLTINGVSCELPVVIQPGLLENVVAVPMGYGRNAKQAGKVAQQAGGFNAMRLLPADGSTSVTEGVVLEATAGMEEIALTQTHETMMGRESIIQETTLEEYKKNPKASRYEVEITSYQGKEKPHDISLWDINNDGFGEKKPRKGEEKEVLMPDSWNNRVGKKADLHRYANHHWGMTVDLNLCTGCSACLVACNVENNVPVVGKKEVVMRREMHWMRVDRYYSSPENPTSFKDLAEVAENPQVVFQPMMCQHCNNAPCETVCPVVATTHSAEGLNQMAYNRCVGTKYCANNCPYKVRRFNWFKYHNNNDYDYYMNNDLGKMVLNPDVTVRSRGVMEKCSLCVQRIQEGKLKAKKEARPLRDGDINLACAAVCSTNAITFGDLNDTKSRVRAKMEDELEERAYHVLDEINVSPNVWYLAKVRNTDPSEA